MNQIKLDPAILALSVLVVDDVSSARRVVTRILSMLGFEKISEASGVSEALGKIIDTDVQLVISDLHLKDGKGVDIVAQANENSAVKDRNVSYIIITSDMDRANFDRALELGVMAYLLKPFSPAALAEKIEIVLGGEAV